MSKGDEKAKWEAKPEVAGPGACTEALVPPGRPCTTHQSTALSHSLPERVSCVQLGLGHSYLSNVLGWSPKKTSLLI